MKMENYMDLTMIIKKSHHECYELICFSTYVKMETVRRDYKKLFPLETDPELPIEIFLCIKVTYIFCVVARAWHID